MSDFASDIQLFVGDKVQLDHGLVIVEAVGTKTADCIDMATGKTVQIENTKPKHLIVERSGQKGLEQFMATKAIKAKQGRVILEPGDEIMWDAKKRGYKTSVVIAVAEGTALLATKTDNGKLFTTLVKRNQNDFFLVKPRRTPEGREKFLAQFPDLSALKDAPPMQDDTKNTAAEEPPAPQPSEPDAGETTEQTTTTETTEKTMAKKSKSKTVKAEKKPKAAKVATVSYAGRPEFIAKLVADGETDAKIMAAVKEKYPGSSKGNVEKTIKAKRAKAKAQAEK